MPLENYIPLAYQGQELSAEQTQEILNQSLHSYASMGKISRVNELIDLGADVNFIERDYQGQPLGSVLDAAISGYYPLPDLQVTQLLLERGAKITAAEQREGFTTVMKACYYAAQAEQMLMEPLALMENSREQVMDKALASRNIAFLILDWAAKEDLIGTSEEGKTALDYASPSVAVTAKLKEVLQKHGLAEEDIRTETKKEFAKKHTVREQQQTELARQARKMPNLR